MNVPTNSPKKTASSRRAAGVSLLWRWEEEVGTEVVWVMEVVWEEVMGSVVEVGVFILMGMDEKAETPRLSVEDETDDEGLCVFAVLVSSAR
jgi:hypothetical protein